MDEYKNTDAPLGYRERAVAILPPKKCMGNILASGSQGLQMELAMAPPIHRAYLGNVKTGMEADMLLAVRAEKKLLGQPVERTTTKGTRVAAEMFARGERVYDTVKETRVTIVRTHVSQTGKGTAIHYVVDSEGNGWKQLETRLRKRR